MKKEIRAKEDKLVVKFADGKVRTVRASRKLIPHIARGLHNGLTWANLIYEGHEHLRPSQCVNVLENDDVYIIF